MFLDQSSKKRLEDKVKGAEIPIAGFIAQHNLPFSLMGHFSDSVRSVENCIGFASDTANNMVGAENSVASRMIEAISHIFFSNSLIRTESVVNRLISQYNAFIDQASQNILQAKSIYDLIQKSETKLYLESLAYVLSHFTGLNRLMQSETPQSHTLYREVTNMVKNILECFIRPDVLNNTPIYDIDF
nr:unnamed protein product [Callosobruchus analis]